MISRVAVYKSYFFEPLDPCPVECKGTVGSQGTEAAERIVILPELQTVQATGATFHHYQVQSPSLLPTSTHKITHIQFMLYVQYVIRYSEDSAVHVHVCVCAYACTSPG